MGLPQGYQIREMTPQEFGPLWNLHAPKIFDDESQVFRLREHLSAEELELQKKLRAQLGDLLIVRLGLFFEGTFVGWSIGNQESETTYYMRNSAVLPEHRRKGLYTAVLTEHLGRLKSLGFQKIYSRHNTTNNAVIIPKLKIGFTISSLEVSPDFGVLVHLVYLTNELNRKMMIYRVGDIKPDDQIRTALGIK